MILLYNYRPVNPINFRLLADYRQDCKSVGLGEPVGVFVWAEHRKLLRTPASDTLK